YFGHLVRDGAEKACQEFHAKSLIIPMSREEHFTPGDAYITHNRYDIEEVNLRKLAHIRHYQLGSAICSISFNHVFATEVLEGGITVISADFTRMGEEAANLIAENRFARIKSPSQLIIRSSL